MRLSDTQRELLTDAATSEYGEITVRGKWLLAARALERRGLFEPLGYGSRTFGVTDQGLGMLADTGDKK